MDEYILSEDQEYVLDFLLNQERKSGNEVWITQAKAEDMRTSPTQTAQIISELASMDYIKILKQSQHGNMRVLTRILFLKPALQYFNKKNSN